MDMFGRKTESVNGGLSVFTNTNARQVYPKSAGATAPSDFGKFPPPAKQFSSLYEQTMSMISKLYCIPDFEYYLFPGGIDALINDSAPVIDPIQILWHCFRLGAPLCHLFNQLEPKNILPVPDVSGLQNYTNVCKKSIFHFLIGIKDELGYEGDLLFTISELYNDDMNKLVKVISTVDIILNELEMRGLMPAKKNLPFSTSINSEVPTDNRSKAIAELLSTERKFVASMQDLMTFQELLTKSNAVSKDIIHSIFSNLGELLDFQRRFLFSLEATLVLKADEQDIGSIFIQYEEGFYVYESMCANYSNAINVVLANQTALASVGSIDPIRELQGLLIQPVQRICRYPMILKEIIKLSSPETYPYYDTLEEALVVIKLVTDRVNEVQRMEENKVLKKKLLTYIEDWQNMNPQEFGDLLLFDKFPMTVLEIEQQYHIYLFEQVLICCKDLTDLQKKREKPDTPTKYEIQGKIYSQTISDVVDTCNSDLQTFVVKIYWNENSEYFLLKCRNIEQAKLWKSRVMNCARAQGSSPTALQRTNSVKDSGMQYGRNRSINAKMDIMDGGSRKSMPASAKRTEMDPKKVQAVKRYPQPTPRGESLEMRRKTQNVLTQSPLPMRGQNSLAPQSPLPARGPPDSALPRPPSQRNPSAPPESDLPRPPSQRTPSARRTSIGQGGASFSGPPDASLPSPPLHRRPSNGPPGQLPQRPPASLLPQPSLPKNISLPPNNFTPPPGSPLPRPPMMSPPIFRAPSTPLPQPPRSSNPLSPPSQRRTSVTRTSNSSLIKMKTYYLEEIFILAMPSSGCGFKEVLEKIERKIKICGAPMPSGRSIKLRYRDEDGDYISINGDDDVEMAFDLARRQGVKGTVMIQVE